MPLRARIVVVAAVIGGLVALGLACRGLSRAGLPSTHAFVYAAVFGTLVLLSWVRPLLVYVEHQSKQIHLDEGFLVVLLILAGPCLTVVTFAVASVLAEAVKHRRLVKSAFNCGQVLVSVGVAGSIFGLIYRGGIPGYVEVGAGLIAALTFFLLNKAAVATILASTGSPWRNAVFDGLDLRLKLDGGGVGIAVASGLLVSAHFWALPIAVLPLLLFRQVLSGHFQARHDRERLDGLFRATVAVHHSMGTDEVARDILDSAMELLRCSEADLDQSDSSTGELRARVPIDDQDLWLSVSGRSRTEPFDGADQALLEALAAVGAGALSNATLYEEGRHQRDRLSAITASLGEGVCAVTPSGQVTFLNPAASEMLGWEPLLGPDDPAAVPGPEGGVIAPDFILAPALRAISTGQSVTTYDTRFQRADGSFFDVASTASPITKGASSAGAVLVFRDITERKQMEEQLARHAFHDALTGLPNRRLFLDHLDHALRRAERSGEVHALLFADIDRFKVVNDSLGHLAGDSLLTAIAERVALALRPGDMLARFGGDEFTVLLEGVRGSEEAVAMADRILEVLRDPINLPDGHEVVARLSIGIALTSAGSSRDDVLHDADVAMYQAKAQGRSGNVEVFDVDAMGVRSSERIELEGSLRRALARGELEVYYQPVFAAADRRVTGVEALVRWNHPERGLLGPEQFIGLAEETGLVLPLGKYVLEEACHKARQWFDAFGVRLSVAVNLSARQFQGSGLLEGIQEVLHDTGVDPAQLCFEITESLAMDRVELTSAVLARLKVLGARVAIDDFGTGYSALGYLANFPIDVVKIDRSFVDGVEADAVKSAIVSAVITMSNAIGSTTVVEGVETEAQLEHLCLLGCDAIQGYYLALPMRSDDFEQLLQGNVGAPVLRQPAPVEGTSALTAVS